jgi:type VI secretion system secreted protein Hcp
MQRAVLGVDNMKKIILLIVIMLAMSMAVHGGAFVKFDGIDGESKDANHDKWIDTLTYSHGVVNPTAILGGKRSDPLSKEFQLTMEIDKAFPKLVEASVMGQVIPTMWLEQTATYDGARQTFYRVELGNVLVTSIMLSGSGSSETVPVVDVTVKYEDIKIIYSEFDDRGAFQGNVEFDWPG